MDPGFQDLHPPLLSPPTAAAGEFGKVGAATPRAHPGLEGEKGEEKGEKGENGEKGEEKGEKGEE